METTAPTTSSSTAPWETKRKPSTKGRVRRIITWVIGLGLLAMIGYGLMPKPVDVEAGVAARGPLTVQVVEEGKTRIRNRYTVAAPVAGQMKRVVLKAGDEVKAGETVITVIEPSQAPLLDARSRAQAEARVEAAKAGVKRAQEALQMAHTAAEFASGTWDRIKSRSEQGSVSINEREMAERDASMRSQEVRASEFATKVSEYELALAEASLKQFDSATGGGAVEVKSPVSGRVLKVMQESSMVVLAGTALVEVGDPMDLEIEAEILSRDAVVIRPGAEVLIEQWGGETPLKGRVRRVEPAAFTKISALGVEEQRVIVLSDLVQPPPPTLPLGDRFRVEVRVATWHADDVLLVPAGSLFREGGEWMTYTILDGKAHKLKVQAGHSNGRFMEVLSGIQPGERVLLHPPDSVTEGTLVKVRGD